MGFFRPFSFPPIFPASLIQFAVWRNPASPSFIYYLCWTLLRCSTMGFACPLSLRGGKPSRAVPPVPQAPNHNPQPACPWMDRQATRKCCPSITTCSRNGCLLSLLLLSFGHVLSVQLVNSRGPFTRLELRLRVRLEVRLRVRLEVRLRVRLGFFRGATCFFDSGGGATWVFSTATAILANLAQQF